MHHYLIYACLLTLSAAAPQFSGYAYNPDSSGTALQPQQVQAAKQHRGGNAYLPPATTPQPALVHKQFYVVGAPEDKDIINKSKHLVIGRPQKNYRVVFIKAPSSENANVKYSAEFAPKEEKTVIYVLTKKDQDLNVDDIATPAPTQLSKPEIFFIKYKTPEEADVAQKEIQAKYNELGGTNEYNPKETVPITNIIGSLDGNTPDGGYDYRQIQGGESSPLDDYLPPAAF